MSETVRVAPSQPGHELRYRAGTVGGVFGLPDADPHWYHTCGAWRVPLNMAGLPDRDGAARRHRKHAREVS